MTSTYYRKPMETVGSGALEPFWVEVVKLKVIRVFTFYLLRHGAL